MPGHSSWETQTTSAGASGSTTSRLISCQEQQSYTDYLEGKLDALLGFLDQTRQNLDRSRSDNNRLRGRIGALEGEKVLMKRFFEGKRPYGCRLVPAEGICPPKQQSQTSSSSSDSETDTCSEPTNTPKSPTPQTSHEAETSAQLGNQHPPEPKDPRENPRTARNSPVSAPRDDQMDTELWESSEDKQVTIEVPPKSVAQTLDHLLEPVNRDGQEGSNPSFPVAMPSNVPLDSIQR